MAITISGSGIVEANLADNAVTLAKMASGTDGEILTYDASGNPVAVSVGTDGQVLTSTGAGSPPAFETAAAGGKVLQVVSATSSAQTLAGGTSYTDISGMAITITPSATSSKILLTFNCGGMTNYNPGAITLTINSSKDGDIVILERYGYDSTTGDFWLPIPIIATHLDSPSSTSAITYKVKMKTANAVSGSDLIINGNQTTIGINVIAMEIGE